MWNHFSDHRKYSTVKKVYTNNYRKMFLGNLSENFPTEKKKAFPPSLRENMNLHCLFKIKLKTT